MVLTVFDLTYSVIIGIISVFLAVAASSIIFRLDRNKDKALNSFQLNKKDSVMDFKLFMYVNLAMTLSFLLFWLGALLNLEIFKILNRYTVNFYGVFLIMLFARWWRRF